MSDDTQPTRIPAPSADQPTLIAGPGTQPTVIQAAQSATNSATAATQIVGDHTAATRIAAPGGAATDPGKGLEALVGRTINGCTIEKLLGRGGMGAVYKATQASLGRTVALKIMLPERGGDPQFADRFVREARVMAALNHQHVVQVYDAGKDADGLLYLVLEFVAGRNLSEIVRGQGVLPIPIVLEIMRQAADGLAAAHAKGLVHRDIKPDNLMIDSEAKLKVMDFGLARSAQTGGDNQLTMSGMILGTPNYISPEAAKGTPTDIRADLYSLGVTMWQLIAGRLPFTGPTPVQVMVQHLESAPPDIALAAPHCPPPVAAMVMKLLAKDPANRHADPAALAADCDRLERELCGGPVRLQWNGTRLESPAGLVERPAASEGSGSGKALLGFAAVAAVLALCIGGMWALWPRKAAEGSGVRSPGSGETTAAITLPTAASNAPPSVPSALAQPSPAVVSPPSTPAVVSSPSVPPAVITPAVEPVEIAPPVVPVPPVVVVAPVSPDPGPRPPAPVTTTPASPQPPVSSIVAATVAAAVPAAPLLGDPLPASEPRLVSRIPASLNVNSIPPGAIIYLDGQQIGTTPALITNLTAGAHELRLVKSGHLDVIGPVMLASGKVTRMTNPLPKPASLELLRIPAGAQAEIAGLAYQPGMVLPSGVIELTLTRNGEEKRYRLTLHPGANVYQVEP